MAKHIYYVVLQWENYPYDGEGIKGESEADGPYYNRKEAISEMKELLKNYSDGDKKHTYHCLLMIGDVDDEYTDVYDYDSEDVGISARNGKIFRNE